MIPALQFPEANTLMKKPSDMTDEQCADLKVWKGNQHDGTPIVISKWQPSKEDIEHINNGGAIYVYVVGETMPPISVQCEYPFYYQDAPPEIYK